MHEGILGDCSRIAIGGLWSVALGLLLMQFL